MDRYRYLDTTDPVSIETVEIKWKGYSGGPNATILPNSFRMIDAFYRFDNRPDEMYFNVYADWGGFNRIFKGKEIELFFKIVSENFPMVIKSIIVRLDSNGHYFNYEIVD